MAYKVLDLFKDLPGTNCNDCGRGGCFAFSTGVYLEGMDPALCPHLKPEKVVDVRAKIEASKAEGHHGKKPPSHVQALNHLLGKMKEADFKEMAANSGSTYEAGPPEHLIIPLFGQTHRVDADDVTVEEGEPPSVWVKVFLYIYSTRANGKPPHERWISFRELPNSVSKSKTFEKAGEEIGEAYDGREADLMERAAALGGRKVEFGSADAAFRFDALPRVPLMLLYWRGGDEFGARAALLVDAGILDYLDQEAIVFMAEAFSRRLSGKPVAEVIP